MRLKPALVLLFLCVITGGLLAQSRKSFTHEPEAFVKELSDMLNASRKKVGKQFVEDEFGPVFLGLEYSDAMRKTAYAMGDAMLKAKMRAYPEFEAYLRFLIAFPTSGRSESDFSNWHVVAMSLLENRKQKKYFDDFVLNSALLYGEGVFYKSASVTWRSTDRDFEITVDSLPKVIFQGGDLICEAKGDSSVVRGTTGTFFPTLERWYGTGGRVTWERADFDPEKTYAEFRDYEIRIKAQPTVSIRSCSTTSSSLSRSKDNERKGTCRQARGTGFMRLSPTTSVCRSETCSPVCITMADLPWPGRLAAQVRLKSLRNSTSIGKANRSFRPTAGSPSALRASVPTTVRVCSFGRGHHRPPRTSTSSLIKKRGS